jgi:hypothetical protein
MPSKCRTGDLYARGNGLKPQVSEMSSKMTVLRTNIICQTEKSLTGHFARAS